ncbi:MAG: immunoglobulin domain-containing protein [Verrucomicrobiota bacterium]
MNSCYFSCHVEDDAPSPIHVPTPRFTPMIHPLSMLRPIVWIFLLSIHAASAWLVWSADSGLVISPAPSLAFQQEGAVASNGRDFLLVEVVADSARSLRATLVRGDRTLARQVTVANVPPGTMPAVASNGADFLVVWSAGRNGPIHAAILNGDGEITIQPFQISNDSSASIPLVASNGTDFLVAWSSSSHYTTRVSASGQVAVFNGRALEHSLGIDVALGTNGEIYLLAGADPFNAGVRVLRLDADGQALGEPIPLTTGGFERCPDIASQDGIFFVGWVESGGQGNVLKALRMAGDGTFLDANPQTIPTEPSNMPIIFVRERAGVLRVGYLNHQPIVVWISQAAGSLVCARIGNADHRFDSPAAVTSAVGLQSYPYFASNGATAFTGWIPGAAWISTAGTKPLPIIIPMATPAFRAGVGPQPILPQAQLVDPAENNYGTMTITLSENGLAEDRLSLQSRGAVAIENSSIRYENTVIGSWSGGMAGTPLRVLFNASATRTSVEAVLRAVHFDTVSSTQSIRTIEFGLVTVQGDHLQPARATLVFDFNDSGLEVSTAASLGIVSAGRVVSHGNGFVLLRAQGADVEIIHLNADHSIASQALFPGTTISASAQAASNGRDLLLVWSAGESGPIKGAILNLEGGPKLNPAFTIADRHSSWPPWPVVASDGTDFLVAWVDARESRPVLYATPVTATGQVAMLNGRALDAGSFAKHSLALTSNGDHYFLVFSDFFNSTVPAVRAVRIEKNGSPLGLPWTLVSSGAYQMNPAVATHNGNYLVIWKQVSAGVFIYGTRVAADGTVLDRDGLAIMTDQTLAPFDPVNVGFIQGKPLVTWQGYPAQYALYARLGDSNGRFTLPHMILGRALQGLGGIASNGSEALASWLTGAAWLREAPVLNPPPAIVLSGRQTTGYRAGTGPATLDAAAELEASATTVFNLLKLDVTGGSVDDRLALQNNGPLAVTADTIQFNNIPIGTLAGNRTNEIKIAFNSNATRAAVQAVLQNLTFDNIADLPLTSIRTVKFDLSTADGKHSPAAQLSIVFVPKFISYPEVTTVSLGEGFVLRPTIAASPSLVGQWRLNGVIFLGTTNYNPLFHQGRLETSGSFTLVVGNNGGWTESPPMLVLPNIGTLQGGDAFANGLPLSGVQGMGRGMSDTATREAGEPMHAGKRGGHSVWFRWQAPANGIATFKTTGSAFDTLLGVYTGSALGDLVEVASDEDRGGFLTSKVQFNATGGTTYHIAIDGFNGAAGHYVISWDFEATSDVLPVITSAPASHAVVIGGAAEFSVSASGSGLSYQWLRNDVAIAGATQPVFMIPSVQYLDVGKYTVQVRNNAGRTVDTAPAFLETGPSREALSEDKLEDLLARVGILRASLSLHDGISINRTKRHAAGPGAFISVAAGAIDGKLLSNRDSTSQPGEPNICGVAGGVSQWLAFQPEADGHLEIDTIGSDIDTLLAVYLGTGFLDLEEVACDDNSAPDGLRSRLVLPAKAGVMYLVVVDGAKGAKGTIKINWRLLPASSLRLDWKLLTSVDGRGVLLSGFNASKVVLQRTGDFKTWIPVVTNPPGRFEYEVRPNPSLPQQFFKLTEGP